MTVYEPWNRLKFIVCTKRLLKTLIRQQEIKRFEKEWKVDLFRILQRL